MAIDPSKVGAEVPAATFTYDENAVILYALGVGAGAVPEELDFVYERDLKVLPTFGVLPSLFSMAGLSSVLDFNPIMLLHGEHRIRALRPLPASATLRTTARIAAIRDKGKGAVVAVDSTASDAKGPLVENRFTAFIRGAGGFGGDRGPSEERPAMPARAPDAVVEQATLPQQALLYRLSGDRNPLHADPQIAAFARYPRPILHGLCTYGHVARAVLGRFCGYDPARLRAFDARFSGVVYPGETLVTRMWREEGAVVLETTTRERGEVVLQSGRAEVA